MMEHFCSEAPSQMSGNVLNSLANDSFVRFNASRDLSKTALGKFRGHFKIHLNRDSSLNIT